MLQSSEKTEFLSNGKNVLPETLAKASEDPVFNLKNGKKGSPINKTASLAKELVKREMENQHKIIFEVFEGNLAYWLLPLSIQTVRILWCDKVSTETIWQLGKVQKIELNGRDF